MRSLRSRRIVWAVALGLPTFFLWGAPPLLDAVANRRTGAELPSVSPTTRELHAELFVADLHADSLMYERSLLERNSRGLVDVPRLIEGGVALQVFTVVSQAPFFMNVHENGDETDMLTLLLIAQRWPVATWGSRLQRALYQAERLHAAARAEPERFRVIHSRRELDGYRAARRSDPRVTAGLLGIEGAQVLEGELANLQKLFDAGFRMLAPAHFFDTEVGGSKHGEEKGGLTPLGRQVLVEMERLGMLVDLAHASDATIDDVLALATRPVAFSHTGLMGACDSPRNLADERARRAAAQGGVIGIGFFEATTCGDDLQAVVRQLSYAVDQLGSEHVALGSDFDGFVTTPIDASQMPALTQALLDGGMPEADVRRVMGGNVLRLLERTLPPG